MDVKLGELGTWIGGRDFTPNGILAAIRRGKETCSDKSTEQNALPVFFFLNINCVKFINDMLFMWFILFTFKGHDRYYNKYINVKKGGIGGIAMLVTGYVVLSYMWEYDHISKNYLYTIQLLPPSKSENMSF